MTPERWEQVGKLYQSARALQPEGRVTFLDDACGDDQALRREVESLLAAEDGAGSFLAAGAMNDAAKMFSKDTEKPLLPVGKKLDHYQVLSLLGAGGMGEVYLAEDTRLKRQVALKLLPAELTASQDRLRRFEREARAASALNHPNIITVHQIGQVNGLKFMVTEFIEGHTLRQLIASARMKLPLVLDVATQVASALTAAHAAGIVHRDLKPENIMLRPDGLIKVLDFGLAKLTESPTSSVDAEAPSVTRDTELGKVMGTAQYMSPEQARGLKVDERSDIFSLGVVLYEMLSGRAPFAGATTADIINVLIHKEPQPLSTLAPDVPAELQYIVSKALRKDKEERHQTARSLLVDLKTLQQDLDFAAKLERGATPDSEDASTENSVQAMASPAAMENAGTRVTAAGPTSSAGYLVTTIKQHRRGVSAGLAVLLLVALGFGYWHYNHRPSQPGPIESIAVLPFVNESGNADVEYLSDGITESLINSLSRLPQLSVKGRSSVFRYKGRVVEPQQVASQLSVHAILNGRVVLHGGDLTLYLSLVEGRNGNQLWGEQYNRKLADLATLQNEIARDVSQKLRARLSGADKQALAKSYTANTEAYERYLKGRYHLHKLTLPEIQTSISYFQQAIEIDPSYALAYVGLADSYRTFGLVGDRAPGEFFPQAKAAAQKAIEIDDTLAEAHAELGFTIFWYDWDWNAAENQLQRALQLDPNNADAHLFYAHLLSNMARHAEALAEVERARKLDPLDLRINGLEAQFLIHAGKADEALAVLQNPLRVDVNSWFTHMFVSSAYIEKRMFAEAVVEARKARELNSANSIPIANLGYALAKSGKQAEARAVLEELLTLSTQRYVSNGNIALVYNGLGKRDETFVWLQRGFEQRDTKIVFLKVEPKWNNLRDDPRFQDLLRRIGL